MPARGFKLQFRKLTEPEALRFLDAVRRNPRSKYDSPIFRLMMESGLKIGEIIGNPDGLSKLQGIQCENLIGEDQIFIRRALQKEKKGIRISRQLMSELRDCQETRTKGTLFDNIWKVRKGAAVRHPVPTMNHRVKLYAKEAQIADWKYLTTEWLRNCLSENTVELLNFTSDIAGAAMGMTAFYALNYCLENSIRRFIRKRLEKYGEWWESKVSPGVKDYYNDLKNRERESDARTTRLDRLEYMTFGQLKAIIEYNWNDFSAGFRHGRNKRAFDALVDLNELRPLIAHSVPLSPLEELRFKNAMHEWLSQLTPDSSG